jgi:hypothetical protein
LIGRGRDLKVLKLAYAIQIVEIFKSNKILMTYLNRSLAFAAGKALNSAFALRNTICLLDKEISPKYAILA